MKKVLQNFYGKILVLVSMLCVFAYTGNGQTHINMWTQNCTISSNEVQVDVMVTNDGTNDLRWNGAVIRVVWPAAMFASSPAIGSQTFTYTYEGGSDFPASFVNPVGTQQAGASWTSSTRTLTWTSTPSAAYNNTSPACEAPLIAMGVTKKIGRFSFKRTDGGFVAGQSATFTWATTSSCNMYQVCAPTVTGYSTGTNRSFGTVCPLTVPSACGVTGEATMTQPTCFGGTGSASVLLSGTGAGAPGTYTVDGGSAVAYSTNPFTVSGLSGGNHTIVATVTSGGCVSSAIAANVTVPAQITGSASVTNPACFGGTGSASVTLSSSTSGTYTVDGGSAVAYSTNPFTVSGLSGGNHTIVATSTAGCVSSNIAANVTEPAALTGSSSGSTSPTCAGGSSGTTSITLSASTSGTYTVDGGAPLSYNSNPFTVSGLTSGSHTVIATSGGCSSNEISVSIGTTAALTGSSSGSTSPTCDGGSSGTTSITLSTSTSGTYTVDGGAPLSYNSNPFTVSGLTSGSHSVVATSSLGCESNSISVTIGTTAALTGSASGTTSPTCAGGTSGTTSITLSTSTSGTYTVDGGAPLSYSSNPFTVSGLAGGNHTIVATSAAGCVSNLIGVNVTEPAALTGEGTTTPTSCGGGPTGTAEITLSASTSGTYTVDGGSPVSYSSNPFTVSGLSAGLHTIIATSAAGCESSNIVVTVGGSASFSASYVKTNMSACNAVNDGTITVTAVGGTGPTTYTWSGGYPGFAPGNVSSVSNLPYGYYNVEVSNSCGVVVFNNIHVQIGYYVFVTNNGSISSSCGNTGSIILYGNAGIQPYTYALSPGTAPAGTYQSSNTFSSLAAGSYTAYVKDAGGCVSTKAVTVGAAAPIVVSPYAVAASSCTPDGSIQVFRSGGVPPYMYSLNGTTYQTSNYFANLASGPYTAYVKDSKDCVGQQAITVAAGAGLNATTSKVNSSTCVNDGSIQVNATGGVAPYMYSLNGGTYGPTNSFTGLGAANYTVQVQDSKGCLSAVLNVTINPNTITVTAYAGAASSCVSNNGTIQLFRTGGYGPYTYSIDGNTYQPGTIFTGVAAGTYTGYVKDAKTCIGFLSGIVVGPTGCEPPFAGNSNNSNSKGNQPAAAAVKAGLKIQAYPNPAVSEFTLQLLGDISQEKVTITVTDIFGRKVYQTEGTGKQQYRFGGKLISGVYNVQVIQGNEKASLKLVKE